MHTVHLFELMIAMLFAVIALHYVAHRLRLPPAVALIVGGATLAFIPGLPHISLDPALVLVIFLPPLLMDGAWFIPLRHLRRHLIAIVSPPDAIAARAVLQRVRLPQRLSILLEGESLLNDATGLVLFRFAVAAAVTGTFSTMDALGSFALLALGGALVGAAVGGIWVLVVKRLRDEYLVIAASVLLGWAAY